MEKILQQCTKYLWNGVAHPLNAKKEQEYLAEAYEIGRKGLRGNIVNCVYNNLFFFLLIIMCLFSYVYIKDVKYTVHVKNVLCYSRWHGQR